MENENPISPQPEQGGSGMVRNIIIAVVVLVVLILVVLALVGNRSLIETPTEDGLNGDIAPLSDEELEAIFRQAEQDIVDAPPLSDEELEAIFRQMDQEEGNDVPPLSDEELEAIFRGM